MTTAIVPQQQQSIVLNVPWEGYVQIGEILRDQPVRMHYTCGGLEIRTISLEHERLKKLIARLVEALTEELNLDVCSGGSTTFKREVLDRGLEADECYWIEHEAQMRDKAAFDPESDPPPDLALEVEISKSIINRLRIYGALGIPEIWRYDGRAVQVLLRAEDGQYQPHQASKSLPQFPVGELARFMELRQTLSETQILRQFRAWVRQQQAKNWGSKKPRARMKK